MLYHRYTFCLVLLLSYPLESMDYDSDTVEFGIEEAYYFGQDTTRTYSGPYGRDIMDEDKDAACPSLCETMIKLFNFLRDFFQTTEPSPSPSTPTAVQAKMKKD